VLWLRASISEFQDFSSGFLRPSVIGRNLNSKKRIQGNLWVLCFADWYFERTSRFASSGGQSVGTKAAGLIKMFEHCPNVKPENHLPVSGGPDAVAAGEGRFRSQLHGC